MARYKSVKHPRGIIVRVGLTDAEYNRLKIKSEDTGVALARLMADAIREVHLAKGAA